jgi:serine/threonine protein kinase/WD40 repeat protein
MSADASDPQSAPGQALAIEPTVTFTGGTESPGAVIGPYKLLQQIGEGGFGVVYMAEQEQPVRRTVALKIIKPGMDSREVIARFEAERQALALMDHQNIARVLDAGTTDRGRPFFVMELVRGVPITEYCNNNRLTPRERLELFAPVCHAIQHAHQKGIIHRDIKPSNVLVCLYDGKPVPKVIDFGVAKAIEQRLTEKTMFTRYGQVVGTLEYMSPEQAESSQLDIDTRSDVYSLGVLLYELLTGSTPITRDQLRQASFVEMLRLIRESEPERPSLRLSRSHDTLPSISAQRRTEPAKLSAILRGELDWVVMKTLEKDRTRRYETALGLAQDIERYLCDEPVAACPPSVGYRTRKLIRRHRRSVIAGGTIAVLLMALLVNFVVSYFRVKDARRRAEADAVRAKAAEGLATERLAESNRQRELLERAEKEIQVARDRAIAALEALTPALSQKEQERKRAEAARAQALDALARSQYEQARAVRLAGQPGRRWASLDLLKQSEAIRSRTPADNLVAEPGAESPVELASQFELRTAAVAALLTSDGRAARQFPGFLHSVSAGGTLAASAVIDRDLQRARLVITDLKSGDAVREWTGADAQALIGAAIANSPDAGKLAVLSLNTREINLWDLGDRKLERTLSIPALQSDGAAPTQPAQPPRSGGLRLVRQLVFSPDGRLLMAVASGSASEMLIVLWKTGEPDAGQVIATVHRMPILTAVFSPDSGRIAFPMEEQKVAVWDIAANRVAVEIELPLQSEGAVGFHPDGQHLGIHCREMDSRSRLLIWDIARNREAARVDTGEIASSTPIAFTRDGHRAAVAGINGMLVVCDVPPSPLFGQRPTIRVDHGTMPQVLAWTADGVLLTGGLAGLKQWELAAAGPVTLQRLESDQQPGQFSRVAFHPDGQTLAASPWHGSAIMIFDRASGTKLRSLGSGMTFEAAFDMRYSPDGARLARFGLNGVVVWDTESGEETLRLDRDSAGLSAAMTVSFRPDGGLLAAGMVRNQAVVRDVATGTAVWEGKGQASMAAVSPNGKFVLTYRAFALGGDLSIPVRDLESNQLKFTIPGPEGKNWQSLAEISPDSRWILALHYGGDVAKSLPADASETRPAGPAAAAPFMPPSPVRFTFGASTANIMAPDQEWIGAVWHAETGQRQVEINGPSTVEYYAFSPDGRYLAVSMRNQSIRLWDVDAARELFDWRPTAGFSAAPFSPRHLAFSADSTTLAVPDPALPVLHLLDLQRLNEQLAEWSLGW